MPDGLTDKLRACPVVLCFGGRGLEGSELFVSETIFEYLVKVMGIAYVFEKG